MKNNILNIIQLLKKGYAVHMQCPHLFLIDRHGRHIDRVEMDKNCMFFQLNLNTKYERCLERVMENETWKYHLRFGHLHFNGLKLLYSKGTVHGLAASEVKKSCL